MNANRMQSSQWAALAVGVVYTLVGLAGFAVTGFDNFAASNTGEVLLGLELNPLHNIVHLVIGVLGLFMWRTLGGTRNYGWFLAVVLGLTFLYGLFAAGTPADLLALNAVDNVIHLLTALVGIAIAWMAGRVYRPMGA